MISEAQLQDRYHELYELWKNLHEEKENKPYNHETTLENNVSIDLVNQTILDINQNR